MEIISFCSDNDFEKLQMFINNKWRQNHILAIDKKLLDFQHKSKDKYNFVISKNDNNEITGVLGFIPVSKFDQKLEENPDIWLAIWKVDEEKAEPGIGFSLLKWLEKQLKPKSIGSIGINTEVKRIYDILGYKTGVLKHYFINNPNIDNYHIANINSNSMSVSSVNSNSYIKEITIKDMQHLDLKFNPLKSITYINNRYLNHPIYNYLLYGVYTENELKAIIVVRKIFVNQSSCMRIVDIQGDLTDVNSIYKSIVSLLKVNDSEYMDCLNHGLSESIFLNLGFSIRDSETIIPNYFEPFLKVNGEVIFAYKSKQSNYVIFKGDSDQDRPNIIK